MSKKANKKDNKPVFVEINPTETQGSLSNPVGETIEDDNEESKTLIEDIVVKGAEDLSEEAYKMKVYELVPKYLLEEFYKVTDCECVLEAASMLAEGVYPVSSSMQKALNKFYYELFRERVKSTACTACILRRMKRIKNRLIELGLEANE